MLAAPRPRGARLLAAAAVLLVAAACAGADLSTGPTLQRAVVVAVVATFSGPTGGLGREIRNGVQVEADAINAAGGLRGTRVEVVAADAELNPAKAAELVRQQLGDDEVALVVGPSSTATFQAARPALERAAVPNCLTQVADDAVGGAKSTFRVGPSNQAEVGILLDGLHRAKPDLKKIGLLDNGDELGRSYDAQLAAQASRAGLAYAGHVVVADDGDQRTALQQVVGLGAQVVVLAQPAATAARTAQAAAQLGSGRPQLAGFATLADYGFVGLAGDAAVGTMLASPTQTYLTALPQEQWPPGYRQFVSSATAVYGYGIDGVQMQASPAGADCVLQWSRAVERAGTIRGADVARAWEAVDVPAAESALGVRERVALNDRTTVSAESLFFYSWAKDGARYRLKQLGGPGPG